MADFELVEGDQTSVSVTLATAGVGVDLSAASLVDRVEARLCMGTVEIIIITTITDAANGKVRLDFPATGLVAGTYTVDWVIVFLNGRPETFRNNTEGKQYVVAVRRRC